MGPRILIVDDSQLALATIAHRVEERGGTAVRASSFAEGCRAAVEGLGGALIDVDLGDGWGPQLAEVLRSQRADLRVAFVTAGGSDDQLTRARALGPVFVKPTEIEAAIDWALASGD